MLTQLTIHNFAIVEQLDLEFGPGMTVISGETGAGKSIMLDALGLALGDRADSDSVRAGAKRAEISASFDLSQLPEARQWLKEQELDQEGECLLRRTLTREGRSRAYINGRPCALQALRSLGSRLIEIHGQHEHQRLLKKETHLHLLDAYAGLTDCTNELNATQQRWRQLHQRIEQARQQSDAVEARRQLLTYQVQELEQLGLQAGDIEALEAEQQQLANAHSLLASGEQLLQLTSEGDQGNCSQLLNHCLQLLSSLPGSSPVLASASDMLNSALIQVEEASDEVRRYLDQVELNPERLVEVEERLSAAYQLARKHRTQAEALPDLQQTLSEALAQLSLSDDELDSLGAERDALARAYFTQATALTEARTQAAATLNQRVDEQLHRLGMEASAFLATLRPHSSTIPTTDGLEEIEFLISTNPGQPAKPLNKIASGGELSRISLAIQVITAQTSSAPTLVFDEVDVGIGGGVAEVVGRLLQALGKRTQILCVTHQPQVASQGNQHLFVSKRREAERTHTQIRQLTEAQRVDEIARMLGGLEITQRTLDHAREMLATG